MGMPQLDYSFGSLAQADDPTTAPRQKLTRRERGAMNRAASKAQHEAREKAKTDGPRTPQA